MGKFNVDIGIAVEDKKYDSNELKVYVPEVLPFSTANEDNTSKQKIKVKDSTKKDLETDMEFDNSNVIVAKYMDLFSNRVAPPDIRQGEQVFLLQYRDTDVYYWFSLGRDDNLRRLEHMKVAISNDSSIQKELTEDNTYFWEMDTLHKKSIRIKTSKSDGEAYSYLIQIDALANTLVVNDDSGNEIFLDSNVPRIRVSNRSNAFVDVNDKDIIIGAPQDLIVKAGRQILTTSPSNTIKTDGTLSLQSNNIALDGKNITSTGDTIGFSGSVQIKGNLISGPIQTPSISNGTPGVAYTPGTVSLENGESTTPNPGVDSAPAFGPRNASAWQQVYAAFLKVNEALAEVGASQVHLTSIEALANTSKMNGLTGDIT